ncbi:hypothetical protein F946_01144 [Acinetobacter johnsonii ANC 3681]|uniref:Helicase ATP-binding domain-containing protein n=1 Tax=Acinetobacter johnsonii ANC 3681 TaxID=1217662 RepID=N9CRU9_ACIJO|nr:DEAD/DEAH box helicase [Acinetobacter johnsonii]ENV73254.1 hypothetical protein F946_01144 [Acinetobacter johnsonii ANC 3681]
MTNLPKKQIKHLLSNQNLADVLDIQTGNTLIRANTGTGKTWYVINKLMPLCHVVFLCPTVGQVKQCEEIYGDRSDIAFIYGDKRIPKDSLKSLAKKNLVMTYDQFTRFETFLSQESILVIDECQKLYGAGYRDKAIQPILKAIKSQKFDRCLFLTATLTEPLFEKLGLHVSQYYDIQKKTELERNITLIKYTKPHILNVYENVLERVLENRKLNKNKVVIIRLNNISISKQLKVMFEKHGCKVMLINREEMANQKCHDMLSLEKIDCDYEVVLCTSIMDEAINLHNADEEIDSNHIIGQHAHPEEVTQFIGRMRKASPPVFIHLLDPIDSKIIKPIKHHEQIVRKMSMTFSKLTHFLENDVSRFASKDCFDGLEDLVVSKLDKAKVLNGLTNEMVGCKGFWIENNQFSLNLASILGRFYQLDQQKCYENVLYLKYRLQQLMPHANITISNSKSVVTEDIVNEFEASKDEIKLSRKQVIPQVAKRVVNMLQPKTTKLKQLFTECEVDRLNPFKKAEQPLHFEIFQEMVILSSRLNNLADIVDTIQTDRTNKVLKLGYQYQSHPIVNIIMGELSKRIRKTDFMNVLHSYESITTLMNKWIMKISRSQSIIALLKEHPLAYLSVNQEGKVAFVEGGSINFLKRYSRVKVLNDKKAHSAKKVRFIGLCAFGYSFNDVPASITQKSITIDSDEYDAVTGRSIKVQKRIKESFDELFEDIA